MSETYVALRAMKVRGHRDKVAPLDLPVGAVIYVDRMKYRVQDQPFLSQHGPVRGVTAATGTVVVPVYSEDNQHESLYLSGRTPVRVIGTLP